MLAPQLSTRLLQCFLQLKSISLHRYVKVEDGRAAGQIADRSPHQKHRHPCFASCQTNLVKGIPLVDVRGGFLEDRYSRACLTLSSAGHSNCG